jgi:hypothetical protein
MAIDLLRGTVGRLSRHYLHQIVVSAYRQAGERPGCDPRDLAEGLGLSPCPWRTDVAIVRGSVLYYPERATLPQMGMHVFRAVAKLLHPLGPSYAVMLELILPEMTARAADFEELAGLQPYAPLALVQAVFTSQQRSSVSRSGVMLSPWLSR